MIRTLFIIIAGFFLWATAPQAENAATPLDGFYCKFRGGQSCLILSETNKPALLRPNEDLKPLLDRLTQGDYVNGIGEIIPPNEVHLKEVHSVGLIRMIGRWRDQQGHIYSIKGFDYLEIFSSTTATRPDVQLNYFVTPSIDTPGWDILLYQDENDAWAVWRVVFIDNGMRIEVVDGENLGKVYLLKFLDGHRSEF